MDDWVDGAVLGKLALWADEEERGGRDGRCSAAAACVRLEIGAAAAVESVGWVGWYGWTDHAWRSSRHICALSVEP